jgi:preprotein translocase subunit SecG
VLLETLLTIIHVGVALFMILVVLVQGGHSGGVGAAFGGGSSSGIFGATGATTLLGKLTYGAAGIFMVTSISLSVIEKNRGDVGLGKKLEEKAAALASPSPAASPAAAPSASPGQPVAPSQQPEGAAPAAVLPTTSPAPSPAK